MRLDKYLKVSRIIKRRTIANEACDAGRVMVNSKIARASYDVKIDDVIQVEFGGKTLKFKVVSLTESIRKEDAALMYVMQDWKCFLNAFSVLFFYKNWYIINYICLFGDF